MEGLDKIGFDCGWDHAEYGVVIPNHLMVGTLADGYHFGLEKRGRSRPKEADRYVRKWLQLRRNAWRRERIFDDAVTPEYIRRIDVPYCPITRERLTYSTGEGSDWSVDRLVNDGGYARGNLVVMSTRANKAKDSLTTKQIVDRATKYDEDQKAFFLSSEPLEGMTAEETMRLYTLTMIPHAGDIMLASRVFVPPTVPAGQVYIFQCYLTVLALLGTIKTDVKKALQRIDHRPGGLQRVIRKITDAGRGRLREKALAEAGRQGSGIPLTFDALVWTAEDVWSAQTGVYDEFHKWIWKTTNYQFTSAIEQVMRLAQAYRIGMSLSSATRVDPRAFEERIGVATGGYVNGEREPHIILSPEPLQEESNEQRDQDESVRAE